MGSKRICIKMPAFIATLMFAATLIFISMVSTICVEASSTNEPSDIVACINGYPIESYIVDGNAMVKVKDLAKFGFNVAWNNEAYSFSVYYDGTEPCTAPYTLMADARKKSLNSVKVGATNVKVIINKIPVDCVALNGEVAVNFKSLSVFGVDVWDNVDRTTNLWILKTPLADYSQYYKTKLNITPIFSGDPETDMLVSMLISRLNLPENLSEYETIKYIYDWIMENYLTCMDQPDKCRLCEKFADKDEFGHANKINSVVFGMSEELLHLCAQSYAESKPDVYKLDSEKKNPDVTSAALHMILHKYGSGKEYASIFKLIMNQLGFNAGVVDGNLKNSDGSLTPHSWNYVSYRGAFYFLDSYMEQKSWVNYNKTQKYCYFFFMHDDNNFQNTHTWNSADTPDCVGISLKNTLDHINSDQFPSGQLMLTHPTFRLSQDLLNRILNAVSHYSNPNGFYMVTLDGQMSLGYNIDSRHGSASVVKAPYTLYAYQQLEKGNGTYDEEIAYEQRDYVGRSGIIQNSAYGSKYTIRDVMYATIIESDNVGYYMLQDRFTIKGYNAWLPSINCARLTYPSGSRWGYVYPRELVKVWNEIYSFAQRSYFGKTLLNDFINAKYNFVKNAHLRQYGDISYPIAHKSGFNDTSYHDTGIVFREIPYIFAIMTSSSGQPADKEYLRNIAILLDKVEDEYIKFARGT